MLHAGMMWFKVTEKSTYHYFEASKETLCGLKAEALPVEHKVVLDKGKCKNCLRLKEKNDQLDRVIKAKRLVHIFKTNCLYKAG